METNGRGEHYDLVVIGAGGAGSTAAGEAVGRGARVALIERWKVGGTCLNVGCDPTKTMVTAAKVFHQTRHAARHGTVVGDVRLDWDAVMARVAGVIDTIRGGDGDRNVRASGIALYKGSARFVGPKTIEVAPAETRGSVGEVTTITADKVILATGAKERVPPVAGLAEVGFITNVEAVALPRQPRSLAIVGGGVIATEFAQLFARFGTEVTILGKADRLLPREDAELTGVLQGVLEREGVNILTGVRVKRAALVDGLKCLTGERADGTTVEFCRAEEILVAAGRSPVVAGLGLDAAGVAYDAVEGIQVDDQLRTTAPQIWAIGDCTNRFPFTHYADYHARIAEHNAMSALPPRQATERVVPWTTFTDPELARVGLTEQEAREAGYDVKCATVKMAELARPITSGETDGLVKLVADNATGRLLGGHALASHAGDMLAEVVLAMRYGLPAPAIAGSIHSYPTFGEAIFWAAFELAKPDVPTLDAARGTQAAFAATPSAAEVA